MGCGCYKVCKLHNSANSSTHFSSSGRILGGSIAAVAFVAAIVIGVAIGGIRNRSSVPGMFFGLAWHRVRVETRC